MLALSLFAAMALQSFLSNSDSVSAAEKLGRAKGATGPSYMARAAVDMADTLIAELAK